MQIVCFGLLRNRWFVPNQFAYFPWVVLCTLHYCKAGQSPHPLKTFLMLVRHCVLMRAGHALHSGTASSQRQRQQQNESHVKLMQRGGELIACFGRWTHFQMLDTTYSQVYKVGCEGTKERGWMLRRAVLLKRYRIILSIFTSDPLEPVAKQHMSRLFVPVGCLEWFQKVVQTAPALKWNPAKTTSPRRSRLGCFVLHQSATAVFTYVPMNGAKKGKRPLVSEQRLKSIQVWK